MAYDPSFQTPAMQEAAFQYAPVDPLGYLARIKAMQNAQNPQNQLSAATGTSGTDLAKIMQILRQKRLLDSLSQSSPGTVTDDPSGNNPSWSGGA